MTKKKTYVRVGAHAHGELSGVNIFVILDAEEYARLYAAYVFVTAHKDAIVKFPAFATSTSKEFTAPEIDTSRHGPPVHPRFYIGHAQVLVSTKGVCWRVRSNLESSWTYETQAMPFVTLKKAFASAKEEELHERKD